jgi:hypothetical protein
MANRTDSIPRSASYIGIGVSTLDTPDACWAKARQAAMSELDIGGRCFALLVDDTMLLLDRHGEQGFGVFTIVSTHDLNVTPGLPTRMWRWGYYLADLTDPATREIWHWLGQLHGVCLRGQRLRRGPRGH